MRSNGLRMLLAAICVSAAPLCCGAAPRKSAPQAPAEAATARVRAVLDELERTADFRKARGELTSLLGQVAAWADPRDPEPFVQAALAARLVGQLGDGRERVAGSDPGLPPVVAARRADLLKYLRANERLAGAMAFTVKSEEECPRAIYDLLDRLRRDGADKLDEYAYLVAAVCVVHEKPFTRRVNENQVRAPKATDILRYFVANQRQMRFDLRQVPPELLIYVVDTTASIDDMEWALKRYQGEKNIGRHFFDIRYDSDHLLKGTEKKITQAGYTLRNIQKYGGVCVDQAYFAAGVGKALGVPTCCASGKSGIIGHTWVGFYEARDGRGAWNLRYGRYREYRVVRGYVCDPQTRRAIPDAFLAVQAQAATAGAADRYAAAALVDAADLLHEVSAQGRSLDPPPLAPTGVGPARPRKPDTDAQLDLVRHALLRVGAYARGWLLVGEIARSGKMTPEQMSYWAGQLRSTCGRQYPDFSMAVLKPMIESVADVARQNDLWNDCFRFFQGRKDLAAEIRLSQAAMWERAGDGRSAGRCYEDIVERYVNAGPFAITALEKSEQKLLELGLKRRVPRLYRMAWDKCDKPIRMHVELLRQSNWCRIGTMYARALAAAGEDDAARRILNDIESTIARLSAD